MLIDEYGLQIVLTLTMLSLASFRLVCNFARGSSLTESFGTQD